MKKFAVLLLFFIILAIVPLAAFCDFSKNTTTADKKDVAFATADTASEKTSDMSENEQTVRLAAAYYQKDMANEALKAVCLICRNNLKVEKNPSLLSDSDMKAKWQSAYSESLAEIQKAAEETEKYAITYKGKSVFIPLSYSSQGYTATSDEYPYLQSVASPWDKGASDFDKNNKCYGISILGLTHIIKQGEDYKTALLWYLPDFEISLVQ